MKLLIDWFKDTFFYRNPKEPTSTAPGVRVQRPPLVPKKTDAAEGSDNDDLRPSSGISGRIVDGGPGKNILIQNKYLKDDGTADKLAVLSDADLELEEESGADPYNTGQFDRGSNWNAAKFRK